MYRCSGCDSPAQDHCRDTCPLTYDMAMQAVSDHDPWGWKHEDTKLDIQAGVKVPAPREGVITT